MMFHKDATHPSNCNRDERNLYAKVFAGFLFAGHDEQRRSALFETPNGLLDDLPESLVVPAKLARPVGELFISFDNHMHDHLADERSAGEFADVAIWGDGQFVTIEAKCFDDWRLEKDVVGEIRDAKRVAEAHGLTHLGHCLIISEAKWKAVRGPNATGQGASMWNGFCVWLEGHDGVPVVFLTWERLARCAAQICGAEGREFAAWLVTQTSIASRKVQDMPPGA